MQGSTTTSGCVDPLSAAERAGRLAMLAGKGAVHVQADENAYLDPLYLVTFNPCTHTAHSGRLQQIVEAPSEARAEGRRLTVWACRCPVYNRMCA